MFLVGGGVAPPGGDRDPVVTQQHSGAAYPEWLIKKLWEKRSPRAGGGLRGEVASACLQEGACLGLETFGSL